MKKILLFFSQHYILGCLWILLFLMIISISVQNLIFRKVEIDCNKLIKLINNKEALIIDIRDLESFNKGHIINSIHIPKIDIKNNEKLLYLKKNKYIILVCSDGISSRNLIKLFQKFGFKNIFILKNGIFAWEKEGLPLI